MNFVEVFLIAVGLAMDAFAVSISNGIVLKKVRFCDAVKFGTYFGVFQFVMPVIGFFCAKNFREAIESVDHWIAFILLLIIGGKMFIESFKEDDDDDTPTSVSVYNMIVLAIATSIDALAVGVSFAFLNGDNSAFVWEASAIIGIVAFVISYAGVYLGKKIGEHIKKNAERLGGIILVGIGIKILLEHLLG